QYLVMLALWEQDAQTVNQLGERLFLDSGTLTPLLKRMQAAGLIARERAREDERRVVVSLTAAGRSLKEEARDVPLQMACATGCSLAEIAEMTQRLQGLRATLSRGLTAPKPVH
ncbi:MAG TPA: MarR family transcriptional regulator, partial [Burkholderiaceae bacterium]|nr:MarR family transcriptional regulator [Burkholderiaceae bacterium]